MPGGGEEPAEGMNITETHSCSEALPRRSHADSAAARTDRKERPSGMASRWMAIRDPSVREERS